jgi:hypothetical protein
MRVRRVAAGLAVGAIAAASTPLFMATPAGAVSQPEVVAEGLDNPYKISFGPDGALYVAEGGVGDPEDANCVETEDESGETATSCLGATGAVTRVDVVAGTQERVVDDLPSEEFGGSEDGASGPVDVEADALGNLYVTVGLGGPPERRAAYGEPGAELGTVLRVDAITGERTVFADLATFEAENNPDADQPDAAEPDSNPFDLEPTGVGGFLAVDAGGNDVLAIDPLGNITVEAVLPFGQTPAPPFLGLPPGTMIPYQPVPTAVSVGANGTLVGQLTGFPFPVGGANVYELSDQGDLSEFAEGFTNVVDVTQAEDGTVYVLEFASDGLLNEGPDGPISRVIQLRTDGTRKVLLQQELFVPNGIAVGPDGMVYVSNGSQVAGAGNVIRVDPTVARDPAMAAACSPDDVPGSGFSDVGGSVHREGIDCVAWYGLMNGRTNGTFGTSAPITRGQLMSVVARLLEDAGVALPQDPPDAFTDDDGNTHEDNINALAALGIVLGRDGKVLPNEPVSRAGLAALLDRAYEEIAGEPLPAGDDAFTDDEGTVLEGSINRAAAAGWVNGTGGGEYNPSGKATRAQVASVLARMLGTLVDEGFVTPPATS